MLGKTIDTTVPIQYNYRYHTSARNVGEETTYKTILLKNELIGNEGYQYEYNKMGDIVKISKGTRQAGQVNSLVNLNEQVTYKYDYYGQLVRENNVDTQETIVYTYVNGGNLKSKKIYDYTTADDLSTATPKETILYEYDSTWKDQLTSYKGQEIRYDAIGNPTKYLGKDLTWTGRTLDSLTEDGSTITYTYNADGLRTKKKEGNKETQYYYSNGLLSYEKRSDCELYYTYDADGQIAVINCVKNDTSYIYYPQVNSRGDIEGLYNNAGELKVKYSYNVWGVGKVESDITAIKIGTINPFRYRGYYYDSETGFYYVSSRYYDPEVGRFISPDNVVAGVGQSVQGYNLYSYCFNNPVNMDDPYGNWPKWVQKITTAVKKTVSKVVNKVKSFNRKVKQDVMNFDVNNTSESKVLQSNYFSSYKGKFVVRTNGNRSGSYGALFITKETNKRKHPSDIVRHEYGHTKQLEQLGLANYTFCIGVPSAFQWGSDPEYYRRPWEITADIYGGVRSRQYPGYETAGFEYLENSKEQGILVWLTID